jgi:hypothetical protein
MVVNTPASRLISSFRGLMKQAHHHYSKSTLSVEAITQLLLVIIGASALPCPAMPCHTLSCKISTRGLSYSGFVSKSPY